MTAADWQSAFARLPPAISIIQFDAEGVRANNAKPALVVRVVGWARPVSWTGRHLHQIAASLQGLVEITAHAQEVSASAARATALAWAIVRRLDDIANYPS